MHTCSHNRCLSTFEPSHIQRNINICEKKTPKFVIQNELCLCVIIQLNQFNRVVVKTGRFISFKK